MEPAHSEDVPIEDVKIPKGYSPTKANVAAILESLGKIGLLHPIGLDAEYNLLFGGNRLEACRQHGWVTMPCWIFDGTAAELELATIDENLCRKALTNMQVARLTARKKELYEAANPETKQHKAGGHAKHDSASDKVSFAEDTARQTGKSRRTVERDAAVGQAIVPEVHEILQDNSIANKKGQLRELAALPPDQQKAVAEKIASGEAKTVAEAILPPGEGSARASSSQLEPTLEERMKAVNKQIERVARSITDIMHPAGSIESPHLADRLETLAAQLRGAAGTVRAAKGAGRCTYCDGKGCKPCGKSGWLTRVQLDSAPEKK